MPSRADLSHELLRLERALAERDPSAVPDGLAALLADDFFEFGASGRTWDRPAMAEAFRTEAGTGPLDLRTFAVRLLADDVALVTYALTVDRPAGAIDTLRSSVWVRRDGRWQLTFHQGTVRPAGVR